MVGDRLRLCLNCGVVKHTKQRYNCPNCTTLMRQVDGRMRKVAETLTEADLDVAFAICDTYTTTDKSNAEIIVGFSIKYDKLLFSKLAEHFKFCQDYRLFPDRHTAYQVLNYLTIPESMIIFEYSRPLDDSENVKSKLKEAIEELQDWATSIKCSGEWSVCKLRGDF